MSADYRMRSIPYNVPVCPKCGRTHLYTLEIHYTGGPSYPTFGGKGSAIQQPSTGSSGLALDPTKREIQFLCEEQRTFFTRSISVESRTGEKIVDVQSALASITQPSTPQPEPDIMEAELREWVKASAANARDFCKSMMTITTGAIPLFFAVLKYLGAESAFSSLTAWIGVIPSSIFLVSTILFILALRPQYTFVNISSFDRYRTRRLAFMNKLIIIGTCLFVLGVVCAIVIFVKLI